MTHGATHSTPGMLTLVLLSGLSVLSLNMFLPSLASIARDLDASYSLVSLSVGGYLAATALVQVVAGPLSDRFGRRPVVMGSLVVFTMASLGCLLATDVRLFLGFRLLQAAMITGWALSLAVIRDTEPERRAASLIGYLSMGMAVAPMVGPMIGGALDELFGWRTSFALYAALGAALLALCWRDLHETNQSRSRTLGVQLSSYPRLLGSGRFWACALCMTFSTGTFYIFLAGAPLVAGSSLALSPSALGVCMGATTAGFALGSFVAGRCAARVALSTMMLLGRVVACAGLGVGLILCVRGYASVFSFFGATAIAGVGNGLTMPGASAGALSARPELAGSASGLAGALTVGGGAVLTTITGVAVSIQPAASLLIGIMLTSTLLATAAVVPLWRLDRSHLRAVSGTPSD